MLYSLENELTMIADFSVDASQNHKCGVRKASQQKKRCHMVNSKLSKTKQCRCIRRYMEGEKKAIDLITPALTHGRGE